MNLAAHQRSERRVHELMALDHAFAYELLGNDDGFKVGVVVGHDLDARTGQSGFNQTLYFNGIHGQMESYAGPRY